MPPEYRSFMSAIYKIAHVGLKIGQHTFQYSLDTAFFAAFDYSFPPNEQLHVTLLFDKTTEHLFNLQFDINGTISAECDRCLANLNLSLAETYNIVVKIVAKLPPNTNPDDDLDLLYLSPDRTHIDLDQLLYEFALLTIPQHVAFPEDRYGNPQCPPLPDGTLPCNQKVLSILKQSPDNNNHTSDEPNNDTYIDPRWKSLRDLS